MPNSKPKESYLLYAKISSDKASNQPTKIFHVTTQYLTFPRENIKVDNKEISA